jgi:hypothetical protein
MTREEATIQALRNHIEVLEENIRALEQNTVSFDFELYQAGLMEMPNGAIDMLDEIRAEIADLDDADYDYEGYYKAVTDALQIIDKYKAESEENK